MSRTVERRNAIETLTTAAGWLPKAPALVGLFFVVRLVGAVGQLNVLVSLVGSLVSLVAAGVAYLAVTDLVDGHSPAVGDHVGTVARRIPRLIGIGIIAGIATFVGTIFFVLPGIYIALRLGLAAVACVVDDLGVSDSLSTSWEVADGNLLKLFAIQLATGVVSMVAFAVVLLALGGGVDTFVQNDQQLLFEVFLGLVPLSAVLGPLSSMAVGRVYLENRGAPDEATLTAQPGDDAWVASESESAQH